jgi:glycosyltransferase involved in cell wall biosynthesis
MVAKRKSALRSTNTWLLATLVVLAVVALVAFGWGRVQGLGSRYTEDFREPEPKSFWDTLSTPSLPGNTLQYQPSRAMSTISEKRDIRPNTGLGKDFDVYLNLLDGQAAVSSQMTETRNELMLGRNILALEHLMSERGVPNDLTLYNGYPRFCTIAFVPNQELMEEQDAKALRTDTRVKFVMCKSRYAASIFENFKVRYVCPWRVIEFKFPPLVFDPLYKFPKNRNVVFHPAGKSWMKSTTSVIKAWSRHPEWPPLVVTCDGHCVYNHRVGLQIAQDCKNVIVEKFLENQKFKLLQRHAGYVIVPSSCEGFGHSVYEAMANGSLLIGADVPPVNENLTHMRNSILAKSTGVNYIGHQGMPEWLNGLSRDIGDAGSGCYKISSESIETAVLKALSLDEQEYQRIRQTALIDWQDMVSSGIVSTRNALSQAGFPVKMNSVNENLARPSVPL